MTPEPENQAASSPPKARTYFIQRGESELGPFSVARLNQMRTRNEISATDLCRASDSTELRPLGEVFPHMAEFVRKSPEEHRKQARTWEGQSQSYAALVCGILAIIFISPVLSVFAIVLGLKSWLRVQHVKGVIGFILGGLALIAFLLRMFAPALRP